MLYKKPMDIWKLQDSEIKTLQSGQWVYAGEPNNKGQFFGMKKSGTVVVAWMGNAKNQDSYIQYIKALAAYARA